MITISKIFLIVCRFKIDIEKMKAYNIFMTKAKRSKKKSQLTFAKVNGWGGKRQRAGRPNRSGLVNHMTRPTVNLKTPMHITLRLKERLPSLRKKSLYKEFKESVKRAKMLGLYVIHFSIQSNHIHLFCEAQSNKAMELGMRALAGRFAKLVRKYVHLKGEKKKGSVFNGRYHLHVLKTPSEVKNALEYVLLNLSKHEKLIEYIDHFSSGGHFRHWRELLGKRFNPLIGFHAKREPDEPTSTQLDQILSQPRSWLGKAGWMKACV